MPPIIRLTTFLWLIAGIVLSSSPPLLTGLGVSSGPTSSSGRTVAGRFAAKPRRLVRIAPHSPPCILPIETKPDPAEEPRSPHAPRGPRIAVRRGRTVCRCFAAASRETRLLECRTPHAVLAAVVPAPGRERIACGSDPMGRVARESNRPERRIGRGGRGRRSPAQFPTDRWCGGRSCIRSTATARGCRPGPLRDQDWGRLSWQTDHVVVESQPVGYTDAAPQVFLAGEARGSGLGDGGPDPADRRRSGRGRILPGDRPGSGSGPRRIEKAAPDAEAQPLRSAQSRGRQAEARGHGADHESARDRPCLRLRAVIRQGLGLCGGAEGRPRESRQVGRIPSSRLYAVPELVAAVQQVKASLVRAEAAVVQANARVTSASEMINAARRPIEKAGLGLAGEGGPRQRESRASSISGSRNSWSAGPLRNA